MNRVLISAIVVGLALPALVVPAPAQKKGGGRKRITVSNVVTGRSPFSTTPIASGFRWLPDGKSFAFRTVDRQEARACRYWVENAASGKRTPFLDRRKVQKAAAELEGGARGFSAGNFRPGADANRIVYRVADGYFFYDRGADKLTRTRFNARGKRMAALAPDGKHVAWVADNNLWVADLATGEDRDLTSDGDEHILNGIHSWVYYEELYHRNWRAFWWSPCGRYLAFFRSDDGPVPEVPLVDEVPRDFRLRKQRYPKVGRANPEVKLGVADVTTGKIAWMQLGADSEDLIAHVAWIEGGKRLAVQVQNRPQSRLALVLCDPATGAGKAIVKEANESWIPVPTDYRFLADGRLVWPSVRDGHRHLYLITADGQVERQVTSGDWTAHRLLAVDEEGGRAFFLGDKGSSLDRQLFSIGLDGKKLARLTREPGTHAIRLSPTFNNFVDTWSTVDTPPQAALKTIDGKVVRKLGQAKLRGTDRTVRCRPELFTYRTGDGRTLPGSLLKPPGFKKGRRYPLLVSIYGGPGSQGVANRWRTGNISDQAFAQMGMVVAKFDHRGSKHLGHAGCAEMHGNLGKWEISDYADGVRHLVKQGMVDPERVGIWGWSYGGYVSVMALLTAPKVFQVGVAVAPVTDWRNYDSIYTERYMGMPDENRRGYRYGSAMNHAGKLEGKLLIMHGMMDDNVHFQNTVQLVRALVRAGKHFDIQIYPQGAHGIGANNARPHLFRNLFNYMERHLLPSQPQKKRKRL